MLLLDSQVFCWLLNGNPRLGARSRVLIAGSSFVHVSAATILELTIKSMLGRLELPLDLEQIVQEQGMLSLPILASHAAAVRRFPDLVRHDPFDRLLMAQASVEGMQLVTADRALLMTGHPFVVDATT